jgi:hypothetical protein
MSALQQIIVSILLRLAKGFAPFFRDIEICFFHVGPLCRVSSLLKSSDDAIPGGNFNLVS